MLWRLRYQSAIELERPSSLPLASAGHFAPQPAPMLVILRTSTAAEPRSARANRRLRPIFETSTSNWPLEVVS